MTKETIQSLIDGLQKYKSVKEIEIEVKIPPTTLQKVLKGERRLPKKWEKPLETYFGGSIKTEVQPSVEVKKPEKQVKNATQAVNSYLQKRMNLKNGIKE